VEKPEGKRTVVRPRHRQIDNIKMDLVEIVLSGVGWIGLAQAKYKWRALVNAVMKIWVPYNAGKKLVASQIALSSTEFVS
jgi:hypothetical protein